MTNTAILWSFRRCPYAMRARLAIKASGSAVSLREIILRDKPAPFLDASAKGTVPVLVLPDGRVIDESLDVMFHVLGINDPQGWLDIYHTQTRFVEEELEALDHQFKHHLDRYKYATRYDDVDETEHRTKGAVFLSKWNDRLQNQAALSGDKMGLLDFATLPFIRQFRIADASWFDAQDWPHLQAHLHRFLDSPLFLSVMEKYKPWAESGNDYSF